MTNLYRIFSREGALLYVGLATRLGVRLRQHEERADWFYEAAYIEVSRFPARDEASAAEGRAIATEHPLYNQRGSGSRLPAHERKIQVAYRRDLETRLATARLASHYGLMAEVVLYCDNTDCPVREVSLQVKEHPGDVPLPAALACPACGRQFKASYFGCVRVPKEIGLVDLADLPPRDYDILA